MRIPTIETAIRIYLDYWNNFLTVQACADYYDVTPSTLKRIIRLGKAEREKRIRERGECKI